MDAENKSVVFDDTKLDLSGQALKRHFKPYTHQLQAWNLLAQPDPRSIVVTSGTGSGKTECFMVPILNDLVGQLEQNPSAGVLEGVQALFVYPLNALINSQRERLLAWTLPFNNKLRFCLYNGNTPQGLNASELKGRPASEVHDRKTLWQSPPPVLITNPTMLEYMLIRRQDRPILDKSRGMLKYIVLDEAHTYIGSQAAELSLLIRRALDGFGVTPDQVRFIATSATVGSGEGAKEQLRKYLANLAGILRRPHRRSGRGAAHIPAIAPGQPTNRAGIADLNALSDADKKMAVYGNETARRLRQYLIAGEKPTPKKLSEIAHQLFADQLHVWKTGSAKPSRGSIWHRAVI